MRSIPWTAGLALAVAVLTAACGGGSSSPSAPSQVPTPTPSGGGTSTPATVAYTNDVKPVLDADCVRCHSASNSRAGVNLSSYATVMRTVTPGSASSPLVRTTQSGGTMNGYLSGDRAAKADLIRRWVVDNAAAESR